MTTFKEDLLQYIWQYRLFDQNLLRTTDGETIEIIDTGFRNTNAGPDFLMAKIKIGSQVWVGTVEIHRNASDWNVHRHDQDPAYNNVVLHIVWTDDLRIQNRLAKSIPCIELSDRIPASLLASYEKLMNQQSWVACENAQVQVDPMKKSAWLIRVMAERLEQKSNEIIRLLNHHQGDWEAICYQKLARALGSSVNGDAMEELARAMPLTILYKHRDSLVTIEALLFGQSGLLEPNADSDDDYPANLASDYRFYQTKYNLRPMQPSQWKFLRMRPANFPTIRIAQLARLVWQTDHLFSRFIAAANTNEVQNLLQTRISQYWKTHYTFTKGPGLPREKSLGPSTIAQIIINTIVPLTFAYGLSIQAESYKEKAIDWLTSLVPEKNQITQGWARLDWVPANAAESQAMIHLKKEYCDQKKCTHCLIGHEILKQNS
jgi:hypothetical protein